MAVKKKAEDGKQVREGARLFVDEFMHTLTGAAFTYGVLFVTLVLSAFALGFAKAV